MSDFELWWSTQHQTIGKVAAKAAWDAAYASMEENHDDTDCNEANRLLQDGSEDPTWRLPEYIPDFREYLGQLVEIKKD